MDNNHSGWHIVVVVRCRQGERMAPKLRKGWRPLFDLLHRKKGDAVTELEILRATLWKPETLRTYSNKQFFQRFLRQSGERYVALQDGAYLSTAEFALAATQVKENESTGTATRMKPCPALAKIIGPETVRVPRVDLPKRLWLYVKSRGLNPTAATIECDEALRALCGKNTISSFELVDLLLQHLVAVD